MSQPRLHVGTSRGSRQFATRVDGVAHGEDDGADDDDGIGEHDGDRSGSDDDDDDRGTEVARCIILQGSADRMGPQRWAPRRFLSDCVPGGSASGHGSCMPLGSEFAAESGAWAVGWGNAERLCMSGLALQSCVLLCRCVY